MKANNLFSYTTIFLSLLLFSCSIPGKKEYYQIITAMRTEVQTTSPAEMEPYVIRATSDSAAYVEAYRIFCLLEENYKLEFQKSGALSGRPISFRLLNEDSVDIMPGLVIANREHLEKVIKYRVTRYVLNKEKERGN